MLLREALSSWYCKVNEPVIWSRVRNKCLPFKAATYTSILRDSLRQKPSPVPFFTIVWKWEAISPANGQPWSQAHSWQADLIGYLLAVSGSSSEWSLELTLFYPKLCLFHNQGYLREYSWRFRRVISQSIFLRTKVNIFTATNT